MKTQLKKRLERLEDELVQELAHRNEISPELQTSINNLIARVESELEKKTEDNGSDALS